MTKAAPFHKGAAIDQWLVDRIAQAYKHRYPVEFEIRRSVFWWYGIYRRFFGGSQSLRVGCHRIRASRFSGEIHSVDSPRFSASIFD